jgi:hypothetical protein
MKINFRRIIMASLDSSIAMLLSKIDNLESRRNSEIDSKKSYMSEFKLQEIDNRVKVIDEDIKRQMHLIELLTRK